MKISSLVLLLALWGSPQATAAAADSIDTAKDLYSSAAYDDALAMLNRLREAASPEERRTVGLYRALCLFALGNTAEADHAMEELVAYDPLYRPTDSEMAPRIRVAFATVRRRVLPSVIQQQYSYAKFAFDREDFATAAKGFSSVLEALGDPDIAQASAQPPLKDLRTLAAGFRDLSAKAAAPPPAPVQAPEPPPQPLVVAAPPPPPVLRVYSIDDSTVVPPVPLRQDVPPFPTILRSSLTGVVEVMVNETGQVTSVTMRTPIHPTYDRLVVAAASRWQYRPATLDNKPVKYRKMIQINLKPTS